MCKKKLFIRGTTTGWQFSDQIVAIFCKARHTINHFALKFTCSTKILIAVELLMEEFAQGRDPTILTSAFKSKVSITTFRSEGKVLVKLQAHNITFQFPISQSDMLKPLSGTYYGDYDHVYDYSASHLMS